MYLDAAGLVALWREALLAQKVLCGEARGYRHHPQLLRFKESADPKAAISSYLREVHRESVRRGYRFDETKIQECDPLPPEISISMGQIICEFCILLDKLELRDPKRYSEISSMGEVECHPIFKIVEGGIADWEKARPKRQMPRPEYRGLQTAKQDRTAD